MNRFTYLISWIAILSAFALIGVVTAWEVYPYRLLEIKNPTPVVNKVVKAGELLTYKVDYCKFTDLSAQVTKSFVNDIIYTMPTQLGTHGKGCGVEYISVITPKELPQGDYFLKIKFVYQVNPMREMKVEVKTEQFTIIQ